MILETPSIYNVPGVYSQGAGGGDEYVELFGVVNKVIEINGTKWLDTDLRYIQSDWSATVQSATNPSVNQLSPRNYWYFPEASKHTGFYYNLPARKLIENINLQGWRIPTIDDWNALISSVDPMDLKTPFWWSTAGTNDLKMNFSASGYQDGNSVNGSTKGCYYWCSDNDSTNYKYFLLRDNNTIDFYDALNGSFNKALPIRLCK